VATSPPYDILELRPEGELVTRITGYEEGPIPITPRDGRSSKIVMGVRLFVPGEDKQTAPDYWDLTSQTLKPSLLAVARAAVTGNRWVRIHKYGSGPTSRFSVELLDPGFSGPPKAETLNQAGP
jgi:hypothetical protein